MCSGPKVASAIQPSTTTSVRYTDHIELTSRVTIAPTRSLNPRCSSAFSDGFSDELFTLEDADAAGVVFMCPG